MKWPPPMNRAFGAPRSALSCPYEVGATGRRKRIHLNHARRLRALTVEAERAMAGLRGLCRGRLAVGASTTIGVYLLPNLLGEYRRRYPDIDLQFDIANTDDIERRLADGTLDAGLTEGLPPNC